MVGGAPYTDADPPDGKDRQTNRRRDSPPTGVEYAEKSSRKLTADFLFGPVSSNREQWDVNIRSFSTLTVHVVSVQSCAIYCNVQEFLRVR